MTAAPARSAPLLYSHRHILGIEGLSPAEISEMVDTPVLTVRTRLFYARRELAEMMRDEPSLAQLVEELGAEGRAAKRSVETEAT